MTNSSNFSFMDRTREGSSDSSSVFTRTHARLASLKRPACHEHRHEKTPLLILKLSSPSFLNTVVKDETRLSLYTIQTASNLTTVMRSDPWEGTTKTADIKWPQNAAALKGKGKRSGGVQVQMRGQRWVDEGSFLRAGSSPSLLRKFSIPNYSPSLKWRQIGTAFWCTTPSVKGPIAILEPAVGSLPPELKIYETFRDKYNERQMSDHQGVSILLLDYIVVTSILLVTDVGELMQPAREEPSDITDTRTEASVPIEKLGPCPPSGIPMTSTTQWRKIMYGEPIYPKRRARSNSSQSSFHCPSPRNRPANVMHAVPGHPNLTSVLNFDSSSDSDPEDQGSFSSLSPDLVPPMTPSPGLRLCSDATASLSQLCLDERLFFDDQDDVVQHHHPSTLPRLVPKRPYRSHTSDSAMPISAFSYENRPPSASPLSRPQSTPPQGQDDSQTPPPPPLPVARNVRSPSLPVTVFSQASTARSRPLPRPPDCSSAPTTGYARSQQGQSPITTLDKYGSYRSRSIPSPPTQVPIRQQNMHSFEPAIDGGPAHLSEPLFYSSHTQYPQFTTPFQSNKAPAETDLRPWMRSRPGTGRSMVDAPPYDVPPPAYNTINFDE